MKRIKIITSFALSCALLCQTTPSVSAAAPAEKEKVVYIISDGSGAVKINDGASELYKAAGTLNDKTGELHDGVGQIVYGFRQSAEYPVKCRRNGVCDSDTGKL